MRCVRRWSSGGVAVCLLHSLLWTWTAAIEPAPKIDGRRRSAVTLRENMTHRFNCQSDGSESAHRMAPPPLLTWYLNGERQRQPFPERGRLVMTSSQPPRGRNSSFSLLARKTDRELVCTAANPSTGESANATVTLNVLFEPEILRVNAHYSSEHSDDPSGDPSGVSLVLFALVRSNPPATVTFMDQSGRAVANASSSHLLVLDSSHSYPSSQLANHTLRLTLSSLSGWGNGTLNASNSVGAAQSNLTLTEFLLSSVEVPMVGIVTGGGMAFMALLILSLIVLCLTTKTKAKAIDEPVEILLMTKKSESSNLKAEKATQAKLPRENMSLPSNMQLNDLNALRRGVEAALQQQQCMQQMQCMLGDRRKRREEVDDEDLSAAYAARGFSRYPMVGYVYKVSSTSSEEIWL